MQTEAKIRSHQAPSRYPILSPVLLSVAALALGAIAAYSFQLIDLIQAMRWPGLLPQVTDRDFANYWLAGRLVLEGDQQVLFSHEPYFTRFEETFGLGAEIRSWSYPPHFLLLVWPLGLLKYKVALIVFLVVTFALFVGAVLTVRRTFAPGSSWLLLILALTGYALLMLVATQNGFITAAAFLFGVAWMKQRPILAGVAFSILTMKPQLGILLPLLLLLDRNWKAVASVAISSVTLMMLSALIFGLSSWRSYLTEVIPYQGSVMTDWYGIFLAMMPTVLGSVRSLGFPPDLAFALQWPVSIATAGLVIWILRRETDPLRRIFTIACGTFLITPYAFNYDMGALSVIAAILVGSDQAPANRSVKVLIAVIAAIAPAVTNLGRANLPVTPLILAAGLIALATQVARATPPDSLETPAPSR